MRHLMRCGTDQLGRDGIMVGACGHEIASLDEVFRCVDCCAPFHRECLRRHCNTDCKDRLITVLRRRLRKLVTMLDAVMSQVGS